ncbi:MAG: type IV pilus assembly protein PilM [Candidatus Nanopelagicales bacterium]
MRRRTIIGLDIGTSSVRAAEVSFRNATPQLLRFGQLALPDGAVVDGEVAQAAAVTAALQELWSSAHFSHRRVILGIANPKVVIRQAEVPYYGSHEELRRALPLVVGDQVPIDAATAVMDFAPLEEIRASDGSRSLAGLLVAAVEEMVATTMEAVIAAGLTPATVDLSPFAVLRSAVWGPGLGLASHPEAVVDIGSDLTSIVVHEDGTPRFVRILLHGGRAISTALMNDLGISLAEAEQVKREVGLVGTAPMDASARRIITRVSSELVDEIRGSLDYFVASSTHGGVTRIVLSGGTARLGGLLELISDRLHLPVDRASALAGLDVSRSGLSSAQIGFVDPIAVVPVGLALGGAA